MDENKSPQDILNEIFERTEKSSPASPPPPTPTERPTTDEPLPVLLPGEPAKERGTAGRFLPWLCMVLGAALLVMGVCLLQLARMNHQLDELRQAVEEVRELDRLREENEQLQQNVEELQERAEQAERDSENFLADRELITQALNVTTIQKWRGDYLFYIGQFMDNGDYPMAALVTALSAEVYFNNYYSSQAVYLNPAQAAQYQAYRQELVDKGYLWEKNSGLSFGFPDQWDPEQNPDMAALGILWCAISQHYVVGSIGPAAQYLVRYQDVPLGDDGIPFPQRLRGSASDEIIQQYELLVNALVADGELVTTDDGTLDYSPEWVSNDVLYNLPFDPPVNAALIELT